jgi:hypothetical protein
VPYSAFRARWTQGEVQALFAAEQADWQVRDYVNLATAQGHVKLGGATANEAKAKFIALGVLSAQRANEIFGV